jgi:hypothetical protein
MLSSYMMTKYKLLWWILGVMALAFGFDFKTPAMAQKALQAQVDTIKRDVDTLFARQKDLKNDVRDIKYLLCLNYPEQIVCQPNRPR